MREEYYLRLRCGPATRVLVDSSISSDTTLPDQARSLHRSLAATVLRANVCNNDPELLDRIQPSLH